MDKHSLVLMVGTSLLACCFVMVVIWLWAYKIKNAGVVDIFWSFNFPLIAVICYLLGTGFDVRKALICSMVVIWGCRLGIYLLIRVGSHLAEEEGRYKQLRKEWQPNPDRKFFGFFQMQAASNVYLAIPFFIICLNPTPELSVLEKIGAGIWLIAISGEAIADWQLAQFKKNKDNKGKVCQNGLWNYSRHPNYFFEWMIWVAYFTFACASPYGWISIVCPLTMLFLIFKLTGIPMTEEQSLRSKGDLFTEYQRTTSVFVPWFKKKK